MLRVAEVQKSARRRTVGAMTNHTVTLGPINMSAEDPTRLASFCPWWLRSREREPGPLSPNLAPRLAAAPESGTPEAWSSFVHGHGVVQRQSELVGPWLDVVIAVPGAELLDSHSSGWRQISGVSLAKMLGEDPATTAPAATSSTELSVDASISIV